MFSVAFSKATARRVGKYARFLFVSFFFGPLSSKKKRLRGFGIKS